MDILDLKKYFHNPKWLEENLEQYDVIWVRGGNTFVLAQAMKLSGFDIIVNNIMRRIGTSYMAGIVRAFVSLDRR